jgi:hypothetical protein
MENPGWNQWLDDQRAAAVAIDDGRVRQRCASQRNGYGMLAGRVAGIEGWSVAIRTFGCLVVVVGSRLMSVRRETVMVLRMIVVGVRVNVQRRRFRRSRRENDRKQRNPETMHGIESMGASPHRQTRPISGKFRRWAHI